MYSIKEKALGPTLQYCKHMSLLYISMAFVHRVFDEGLVNRKKADTLRQSDRPFSSQGIPVRFRAGIGIYSSDFTSSYRGTLSC